MITASMLYDLIACLHRVTIVPMDSSVKRIGAVDSSLVARLDPQPSWRRVEAQTGYSLPSYSLSAMFSAEPWKLAKIKSITNT
jgi:hypothetical protein